MSVSTRRTLIAVVATSLFWIVAMVVLTPLLLADGAAVDQARGMGAPRRGESLTDSAIGEGTRLMAERLNLLAVNSNVERNQYLNAERVERIAATEPPSDPQGRMSFDLQAALEYLKAGRTAEAISRFESLRERVEAVPAWRASSFGREARSLLAVAYLRQGEQANCIEHHGPRSCLLPIRDDGVHLDPRGARAAIRELESILARNPEDLGGRWLLNIAYMAVGGYPHEVPEAWRIPPSAFDSDYDVGRFVDVAAEAKLDIEGLAGAGILEDFDGDGYLDVLVTSFGLRDQIRWFRNERDGTFSERTDEAGLKGIVSGLNAVHADYDNDGDMDVFVPRGAWLGPDGLLPPSLLRNRGDGRFDDVTEEAGLLTYRPSQVAAWGDYDDDGWLDLYVAYESSPGGVTHPNALYRNNRDGTFTDMAVGTGVAAIGFFKGAVWGDYDNDGRLDLYLTALQTAPANRLFHNDGPDADGQWAFTDVTAKAGVAGPRASFPTWFFDYDNDGWLDLFVSGYEGRLEDVAADYLGIGRRRGGTVPRLYRNLGDGTFRDVARQARLDETLMTMGCNYGDLDNDGWLDFYLGTGNPDFRTLVPNRMFRNAGGRVFEDVTTSGGFGHLQKGHGIAFGDVDNDGDQDVLLKAGGAYTGDTFRSALFENPGHGNRWITLTLIGVESNRSAVGARIKVTVEEPEGTRDVYATVSSGSSFGGSPLRQEIGLGRAERLLRIEITWPSSKRRQLFENVAMDGFFEIREGDAAPRRLRLDRVRLGHS